MMNILATALFLACLPTALIDFAAPKWKSDPNVRIEDAYKYVFQATRGGEHAAPSRDEAWAWLSSEWSSLGAAAANENEWEPLCPGGEIGRLNLRPYKAAGGKSDALLDAFLASAREYRGEPEDFISAWAELGKSLRQKKIGAIDHKAWKRLDSEMRAKGFPAIHHSRTYEAANHPAYRVLTLLQAQRLIPN